MCEKGNDGADEVWNHPLLVEVFQVLHALQVLP